MRRWLTVVIAIVAHFSTVSGSTQGLIFSDGFETGDTSMWSNGSGAPFVVTRTTPTLSVTPFDLATFTYRSHPHPQPWDVYAFAPRLVLATDESSRIALGVHDVSLSTVVVVPLNVSLIPTGELTLATNANLFGGFDLTPTGYAAAWVTGDSDESYLVSEFDMSGTAQYQTALTGMTPLEDLWSKQAPMRFGSGRIVYDGANSRVGAYLSHLMKWNDGVKHQGGLLKFLDSSGTILGGLGTTSADSAGGHSWLYSHNFDQRIVIRGAETSLLGLGDAYPRAVAFRNQTGSTAITSLEIFDIPGSLGDNDTYSQLGGLVALANGDYLAVFTTAVGREARDVVAIPVSSTMAIGTPVWLTQIPASQGINAINAKVALWGSSVLVGWETVSPPDPAWEPTDDFTTYFQVVDADGNPQGAAVAISNVRLPRGDDWVNLPNGDVAWATGEGSQVTLYRVSQP